MEYLLAYGAGLLTLINPCVLPVVPIVLASALQASRFGPLALAAGMSLAFVGLGLTVTAFGHVIGITEDTLAQAGAVLMIGFGLLLLVPQAGAAFAGATAGIAARADSGMARLPRAGLSGHFAGGLLLGAVWSPCIGPTLGGAIALAAQGESLAHAGAIMTGFALGVSNLVLALAYGLRATALRPVAAAARPVLGAAFLIMGAAVLFGLHHIAEAWLIGVMPPWLLELSVSL